MMIKYERDEITFDEKALEQIEKHAWNGNIREMENKIKRAVIMADGKYITREDLGLAEAGDLSSVAAPLTDTSMG